MQLHCRMARLQRLHPPAPDEELVSYYCHRLSKIQGSCRSFKTGQ